MSSSEHHVIDSWIAELGLEVRAQRRASVEVALPVTPTATLVSLATGVPVARRNWTEPRRVSRARGDRPARILSGASTVAEGDRPARLGLA